MTIENKYHKIISFTLLLFLIITIQHYGHFLFESVFFCASDNTTEREIIIPALFEEVLPLNKTLTGCDTPVCNTVCSSVIY